MSASAAEPVLRAKDLGRWYGQVKGLNDLSVDVGPGVTGLIGPNGAGKSTFLRLIAGELQPSRGGLTVLGEVPFANRQLYRRLGFCPQQDALYDSMTGRQIVRYLMRLAGFGRREADRRAVRALERCGLAESMDRRTGGYSKGMRQRVRLAQAIGHDPAFLLLDEPLTGLDPVGRKEVLSLLRELGHEGTHVLVSSHVLHELESLTSEILLIHRGRLLAQGELDEIRVLLSRHPRRLELRARHSRDLARVLLGFEGVLAVRLDEDASHLAIEARDLAAFQEELTRSAAAGTFGITSVEVVDTNLEAIFDYLV